MESSEPILHTGRELLRRPHEDDAAEALRMLRDPAVALWNHAPAVTNLETARDWCRRGGDWSDGTHVTWAVADVASGRLVGNVSLHAIDAEQASAAIGYRVTPDARGRGVATRALAAATEWAFPQLAMVRIQLEHAVANPASCTVANRCGYQLEGTLRAGYVYGDGQRYDTHLHARLAAGVVGNV